MKIKGTIIILGAIALFGCNSGDTPTQTYQAAPGQITDPNAPPAQATAPKNSSEAITNGNLPPAARQALTHGK